MGRPRTWILPVVAAFLLLSTCGIAVYVFLNPPSSAGASGDTFRFKETTANDEIAFLGFELYYKLYSATPPPEEENIKEQTALISKGFKRISSDTDKLNDIDKPLIVAPPGINIDFTVDFGVFEVVIRSPEIRNNAALPTVKIRRGVTDQDLSSPFYRQYKHFHHEPTDYYSFVLGDADVDSGVAAAVVNDLPVTIVVYALSYGLKDFTQDIYSEAVFLGKIAVTF